MLLRVHHDHGGRVVVAWEGTDNFRHKLFPAYKPRDDSDERRRMVAMIDDQERKLRKLLKVAGIPQYIGVECEADDVMGTLARRKFAGAKVSIYTMDSDLRQLVDDRVTLISADWKGGDVLYTPDKVRERYGVEPSQVSDLKALMGDTSDGIPGVAGIGAKTAAKLIVAFKSVGGVVAAAELWSLADKKKSTKFPVPDRFAKAIADEAGAVQLYHKLTTINCDVRLKIIKPAPDESTLELLMHEYQFRTLVRKIPAVMALAGG